MKVAQAQAVANQPKKEEKEEEAVEEITIDDFLKVQLKVGEVISSEKVKKSKKLLRNVVKIGDEERVIFSGISEHYSPEEMVGKRVIVVTNLKPRKMMGEYSYGMILAGEDSDGNLSLATVDKADFESGSEVG